MIVVRVFLVMNTCSKDIEVHLVECNFKGLSLASMLSHIFFSFTVHKLVVIFQELGQKPSLWNILRWKLIVKCTIYFQSDLYCHIKQCVLMDSFFPSSSLFHYVNSLGNQVILPHPSKLVELVHVIVKIEICISCRGIITK